MPSRCAAHTLTEELGDFHAPDLKLVDVAPGERVKLFVRTTLPHEARGALLAHVACEGWCSHRAD
ncbi:MAG TPA: hypothetical protein VGD45_04225 [Steroidobacter sp.]|uniref:hypothetical protein n=1 Tax=Steroidobacter sp. TaxID=1978227 RepID=UPI002EDAE9B7